MSVIRKTSSVQIFTSFSHRFMLIKNRGTAFVCTPALSLSLLLFAELVHEIKPLPRQVKIGPAKVAVRGRLPVNRRAQP